MYEESWLTLSGSVKPAPRLVGLASQSFELPHRPSDEMLVDAAGDRKQLGAVEDPVIVDPASYLGVDRLGEAGQIRSAATVEMPVPDLLADRFTRLVAHRR